MKRYLPTILSIITIAYLVLFAVYSCDEKDPIVVTGNIEGTISDNQTNSFLGGVNISLVSNGNSTFIEQSKTTGADGKFSFKDIEAGSYKLSFKKEGYEDNSKNISLQAGQTSSSDIELAPILPELSLLVTELNFGNSETSLAFQIKNAGKGELNWEVKEDIGWLSVNPVSGTTRSESSSVSVNIEREYMDPGNYERTISVTSNGGNAEILVKIIIEGPKLEITPLNLDFGSDIINKTLFLKNIGAGNLEYSITTDESWISITPNSGNITDETDQVEISVSRNGLNYGNYSGSISLLTNANTIVVDVQMTVADPNQPQLSISPTNINFGTNNSSEILTISNTGNGVLEWNLNDNQDWIDVNKNSGELQSGASTEVTVIIDRFGQSPGNYAGFITVTSNGGEEICNIQMEILAEPSLFFEPTELNFGSNELNKSFTVKNIGTGNLSWELSTNKGWITLSENNGTNQSTVNVTVDRNGLAYGDYSGQVNISSNGGAGNVSIVMVNREANKPPTMDFSVTPSSGFLETNFVLVISCEDDYSAVNDLLARWKWEDTETFSQWSTTKTGSHSYGSSGAKNITVQVKDEEEETTTLTKSVEVYTNEKPVASFTITPETGTTNTEFSVDASACTDDYTSKENLQVRWQWESNAAFTSWTTTKMATHTYSSAGNKTITLEVKDETGLTNSTTHQVTLLDGEQEPNNSTTQAQMISLNTTIPGDIGYEDDDADFFEFTPTENGNFCFSIKNLHPTGITYGRIFSGYLYKYGESNYVTATGTIYVGTTKNSSTVPISKGTKYYLQLYPVNSESAPYELTTIFEPINETDVGEPNDLSSQATAISLNASLTALIGYSGDEVDYFEFTPTENGNFSFSVKNLHPSGISGGTINKCYLYQYGESNYRTYTSSAIYEATTKNSSTIPVSKGIKYVIQIPQYNAESAPYELRTVFEPISETDVGEPNNLSSQATDISLNTSLTALIGYSGDDVDFYEFTATENGNFSFSVKNLHPSGISGGTINRCYLYRYGESNYITYTSSAIYEGTTKNSSTITVSKGIKYVIQIPQYNAESAPYELRTVF